MKLSFPSAVGIEFPAETGANNQSSRITAALRALHLAALVAGMLIASSAIWYMQLMALSR